MIKITLFSAGFISVTCDDSTKIILNPDVNTKMTAEELMRGVRTLKRCSAE